jgi:selenocysteine lyase/cysteine desulfurase
VNAISDAEPPSMTFCGEELERLRADTPGCRERIHLNNAGAGLMPRPVSRAIIEHLELESRIGGYEAAEARTDAVGSAYEAVARLVGGDRRNVAFTENATSAYAQALSAIPFEPGDTILTSSDDYVSNQLMFLSLARRLGVRVERGPNTREGTVDVGAIADFVRRHRPRLVALTHVPTNSGLVQPIADVGRVCRECEVPYLVDVCQSIGQLPLDVEGIGCDFLSATSRKFLRGPRGSGFLIVSDRILQSDCAPLFIDLRGATWTTLDAYRLTDTAARFENWEFAYGLMLGTGAAADYGMGVGIGRIAERVKALAAQTRAGLREAGLRVLDRGAELCGIVTVQIPGWEAKAFHVELEDRGINTSVSTRSFALVDFTEKGVEWALRLSPHYYNTEDEIRDAVSVIADLTGSERRR